MKVCNEKVTAFKIPLILVATSSFVVIGIEKFIRRRLEIKKTAR